jgi:2-polyprenyl-3-methyl-5-hydroxy-6-metoxy-1,4-benzoquinol methylase
MYNVTTHSLERWEDFMISRRISCNACGADTFRLLSTVGEWNIGRCTRCGLVYLNPAPFFEPDTEFSSMSKGFQYTRYMHEKIGERIFAYETAQLRSQVEEIRRLTGQTIAAVRYLEVGCGSGASVRAAADLGWEATGIDIDPELIATGVKQHGADLRCTPLLQAGFSDDSFDFVRLRDVIEHLPDPYESLRKIRCLLRPGGIALIVAPNEGALINRFRRLAGMKRTMVAYAEPPHHIHGFTPVTLRLIVERAGFKVLELRTIETVHPGYVTSNNMRSAHRSALVALWKLARTVGMGNFIVSWIQNPTP